MTLCYPQLSTGASAQFPLSKTTSTRTVMNRLGDGSTIRLADPDSGSCEWELQYRGLSAVERTSLEEFFKVVEGRLLTFLFLDPCGNLLAWSDEPDRADWSADPLLRVEQSAGITQITNTAQTRQTLKQSIDIPGWNRYCFSGQIKSASGSPDVRLFLENSDGHIETSISAATDWQQGICSGDLEGAAETITCGISIPAGAVVKLRHLQLQAQGSASGYRVSTSKNGIFRKTRFDDDTLAFQADGIDNYSTLIRLISRN
ncbi:MAG: hypothetical protein H7Y20_02205 [Bryobacteraceae bacterium]|nr:hypothetical protein [Bryobacteraceae bacterium]